MTFRQRTGPRIPDRRAQAKKWKQTESDNRGITLPRFYPILDTGTLERLGFNAIDAAEAILEAGAGILQFRHKTFWSREAFEAARQIGQLCKDAGVIFVVNDRADYALLLKASLHLGQEDLLPSDARKVIGSDPIIGFSTHNATQMHEAADWPVDYVAFGPVFGTSTKERADPTTGLEALARMRGLTDRPLVAIGGINRQNAAACFEAGADSVAVIADLYPDPCNKTALRARAAEWHRLCGEQNPPRDAAVQF